MDSASDALRFVEALGAATAGEFRKYLPAFNPENISLNRRVTFCRSAVGSLIQGNSPGPVNRGSAVAEPARSVAGVRPSAIAYQPTHALGHTG